MHSLVKLKKSVLILYESADFWALAGCVAHVVYPRSIERPTRVRHEEDNFLTFTFQTYIEKLTAW